MIECQPGIYEVLLETDRGVTNKINIFIIPGNKGGRSLMIDTGFRDERCLKTMESVLGELGIAYEDLDVFMTHKHHDHSGLASIYADRGATIYMNPLEERHPYDCLFYSSGNTDPLVQAKVLHRVGVTEEGTPQIWDMFEQVRKEVENHSGWMFEVQDFPYKPIGPGEVLKYGDYTFETVELKGHTFGQLGLFDKENKIFFCADQVIDGIVPIVATTYPDEHLLKGYFASMERFRHEFSDCLLFPAHGKHITDPKRVVGRIVFSYLDKMEIVHNILEHSRRPKTIREIASIAYGMPQLPKDTDEFIKLKMVMSKCFSCLEYLRDEDFAVREEKNGTFYWRS